MSACVAKIFKNDRGKWKKEGYMSLEYQVINEIKSELTKIKNTPLSQEKRLFLNKFLNINVPVNAYAYANMMEADFNDSSINSAFDDHEKAFIDHFKNCFIDGYIWFINDGSRFDEVLSKVLRRDISQLNDVCNMYDDMNLLSYDKQDEFIISDDPDNARMALVSNF